MPWYDKLSDTLKPYAELVLIGIIIITILILVFGEKYSKLMWATYLISP
jgi:hypothetical protein